MGGVVAKLAFVPPYPQYSEKMPGLHFVKTREGDTIPYVLHDVGGNLTVVFGHANAEDLGMINTWIKYLSNVLGVNTVAYEYPGYGLSTGKPNEKGTLSAAEACLEVLPTKHRIRHERCVVWGRSIGCGPSTHLAAKYPVRGLILQSAPASIMAVPFGVKSLSTSARPFDMFDNVTRITKVLCPVFVIHGTADEVCPVDHGLQLFAKCSNPWQAWTIPTATHDNIEMDHLTELIDYVRTFFEFVDMSFCPPSGKYTNEMDLFMSSESSTADLAKAKLARGCM